MDDATLGQVRAAISTEMTRLHREYYGRGPTKARTYIQDDLVAVVLEETFTRAERTLVDRGEIDAIQQIRRRFQQQMSYEFISTETSASRFVSLRNALTLHGRLGLQIEIFLLAEDRTESGQAESASRSQSVSTYVLDRPARASHRCR